MLYPLGLKDWLGRQRGAWQYKSSGIVYNNGQQIKSGLSTFGDGNVVTLKLDLSKVSKEDKAGGTLSAFINGKSSNEEILVGDVVGAGIATGMDFTNGDDGFYPAISGHYGCRMKFVGFDKVE